MAGLLHDFDYERYPETHPRQGAEELRRLGYDEDIVDAVLGHGDHTGVPRTTLLAHVVYACDEMSGFVIAVAYVRPNRSLDEVDVRSVVKKMRDKGFARQVPRDQLEKGAVELGPPARGAHRQRHRRPRPGARGARHLGAPAAARRDRPGPRRRPRGAARARGRPPG